MVSDGDPKVAIVTPFFNTATYLRACIESVLGQSYKNFEYILVDNQSTDGSSDIAEQFVEVDKRLRVYRTPSFYSQIQNYNFALTLVSDDAKYIKIVQADDFIMPSCVAKLVDIAERNTSVKVVASYLLEEYELRGAGVPYGLSVVSGKRACAIMLLLGYHITGSPSTVLLRADVVRGKNDFFPQDRPFADTEAIIDVLLDGDLGFVHEVLSFARLDASSITGRMRKYDPLTVQRMISLCRVGQRLDDDPREVRRILRRLCWRVYRNHFRRLMLFDTPGVRYYRDMEKFCVPKPPRSWFLTAAMVEALWIVANPGMFVRDVMRRIMAS